MTIYQPYTYLIGWTNHNIWYYGVRYAANCNPSDLWKSYYTSSNHVKMFRETHGEPDVIEIRKTFDNRDAAILWEQKVLKRLKVVKKDYFLNKNDGAPPPALFGEDNAFFGKTHSEEVLEILRRPKSEETKIKFRKPRSNTPNKSEEHKRNISKSHIGLGHDESARKLLSEYSQKYKYIIENVHTGDIYESTNLMEFCKDKPQCSQGNLTKTSDDYKGKKKAKQSGGYRIIEKTELPEKKIKAILRKYPNDDEILVEDFYQFCKDNALSICQLKRTLTTYEGKNKLYTSKGYTLLELFE